MGISKKFLTLAMQLLLFAVILVGIGKNLFGTFYLAAEIGLFGVSCIVLLFGWKGKIVDEKEIIAYGYLFLGLEVIAIGLQGIIADFKNLPMVAGVLAIFFLVFFLGCMKDKIRGKVMGIGKKDVIIELPYDFFLGIEEGLQKVGAKKKLRKGQSIWLKVVRKDFGKPQFEVA